MCWNSLGEKSWLNKQTATKKKGKADKLLIDGLETRDEGTFAGLKNLGATCYANCPMQLLNNIPIFRSVLSAFLHFILLLFNFCKNLSLI